MRKVLFQASRTTGKDENGKPVKEKVTKEVRIPEFSEELSVFANEPKQKITVGYEADGTRIREEVDFVTAMFLEGYKLYIGKQIAPDAAEEEDEELNDALALLTESSLQVAEFCLSNASGKKRKAIRDNIVNGTWKSPF